MSTKTPMPSASESSAAASDDVSAERLHVETDEKAGRGLFKRLFGNSGAFDFNTSNDYLCYGCAESRS